MLEELIEQASSAVSSKFDAREMLISVGSNCEKLEMGLLAAKNLGLDSHIKHYRKLIFNQQRLQRITAMEKLGWPKITVNEVVTLLFPNHQNLTVVGTNKPEEYLEFERHAACEKGSRWHDSSYVNVVRNDGEVKCKYYRETSLSQLSTKASKILIKSSVWAGNSRNIGIISGPDYLINFIPPELLARMVDLAATGLVDTFVAAGYIEAFDFTPAPRVHTSIDPIILAVIDNGFGIANPLREDSQMFFVGKYI